MSSKIIFSTRCPTRCPIPFPLIINIALPHHIVYLLLLKEINIGFFFLVTRLLVLERYKACLS